VTPDVGHAYAHDRVGPYQLVKAIGAGGSARIDLARIDRAYGFQRHVVIKRPLEHLRGDPRAAMSLRREASIGARLRHPNLVAILDAGQHDDYDYLVLEYVHGGSLRTLMQMDASSRVRDCAPNVAIAIVGDVARALHEAHELADEAGHPLGLVHRDVSPGNVLIGLDGSVKLADFGIAKETRVQTLSGSMHGTVTYMAPEQCRGHAFDRRADVFSLGVILYELVTGVRLFWADNDVASLHRVLSGNVPRPRKVRPTLSTALEEIVMTAVAHEQDKRFTTARDFADALESYAQEVGEILGARWTARWAHDILGPREAPWIGAPTVVDMPAVEPPREPAASIDGSLVDLIEALAREAADDPPNVNFGPTVPGLPDEVDTQRDRKPAGMPHGKKLLAAVIAFGLAGGAGVTALVMTRSQPAVTARPAPAPAPAPARIEEQPVPPPPPAVDEPAPVVVDDEQPVATPIKKAKKSVTKRDPKPAVKSDVVVEEPKPVPPPPVERGSAHKPVWTPDIILPTDSGSGTKKK
jgi:serine/threonine-protein kinase